MKDNMHEMFEQAITIVNFIIENNSKDDSILQLISIINETYTSKNIKGMKYIYKDLYEWANSLPNSQIIELSHLLKEKFDVNMKIK